MTEEKIHIPTALDAPDTDVTPLTLSLLGQLLSLSRESGRRRMLQKLHKSDEASVHRMFNALQPGTYFMPHRHLDPIKDETILVMAGAMMFIEFTDEGEIARNILLQPGTEIFGVDVAPHVYHTYIPLKPDTLIFECKTGPYVAETDKNVPDWAPREGSPEAEPYLLNLIKVLAEQASVAAEQAKADEDKGKETKQ
ncbi:WbuC family cupin fold metalloprotein [Pseudodesulfovibrio sediminis]|nr:WbuC family cupin fold metalloprotein [Pseudodesulfovibrio sediminis]